ncbi:uncharacterized protein LOC118484118 [Helianthus annuus]|uniref:uncharacterized protein LOC118484118 n=1 Tax=Helianthus annuus TaxID=4232 RepID=UPI0016532420|nr:uncharacterized protein LOC118484118 [Helianthus annuus]
MACSSARGGRGTGQGSGQGSGTVGRIHSDAYETLSQHESSDDEEPTVGRRGPVAPTPLPEPRNREQICVIYGQFSNQGKATRTMGETLEAMWSHPWKSWKDVSKEDEDRMFERFKLYYQWENELDEQVRSCWLKFMKRKIKDVLSRARESAKAAASNAGVEVGDDLSVIIPYKPRWMGAQIWETLIQYWNTKEWKDKSTQNKSNRGKSTGGKHTLGSQTYATLKQKMDKELGRSATVDEVWMQSHGKKGTRPLDILLSRRGGEDSQTADGLDEIDLSSTVKWVDSRAENSLKSYKKYVKDKYGDDASKRPLFDEDSWIQAGGGKKKGRIYGFNDINDPQLLMTGTPSTPGTTSRNEEVQRLNEEIRQLRQEKETERLEKEKERAEKLKMMEQIEENRIANAQMKEQVQFLLKNISKK